MASIWNVFFKGDRFNGRSVYQDQARDPYWRPTYEQQAPPVRAMGLPDDTKVVHSMCRADDPEAYDKAKERARRGW